MPNRFLTLGLLLGVMILGTGAAPEAVRQVRMFQRSADLAMAIEQYEIAYDYYQRVVEVLPDSRYARFARSRMRTIRRVLARPARPSSSGSVVGWTKETFDFFTWP